MTISTRIPLQVASAPVSWGVMEETDATVWPTPQLVIEEISAAGYSGTELGPYGYYPTDPEELRATLALHALTLTSAFVPLRWFQPERTRATSKALIRRSQKGRRGAGELSPVIRLQSSEPCMPASGLG